MNHRRLNGARVARLAFALPPGGVLMNEARMRLQSATLRGQHTIAHFGQLLHFEIPENFSLRASYVCKEPTEATP